MSDAHLIIATVAIVFIASIAASVIDRWAERRRDTLTAAKRAGLFEDDCRTIDILKRGDVLPFRQAD